VEEVEENLKRVSNRRSLTSSDGCGSSVLVRNVSSLSDLKNPREY